MAHPKGLLIERAQKLGLDRPEFETAQTGPEHEPSFLTDVTIGGELLGTGQGGSKREAERRAAEEALTALDRREGNQGAPSAKAAEPKQSERAAARATKAPEAKQAQQTQTKQAATKDARAASRPAPAAKPVPAAADEGEDDVADDAPFAGPWPMVDDVLASVIQAAERRVSADLRGEAALVAIRDFTLRLYKEILADLGEVVDEDEEETDED